MMKTNAIEKCITACNCAGFEEQRLVEWAKEARAELNALRDINKELVTALDDSLGMLHEYIPDEHWSGTRAIECEQTLKKGKG
jgi:hypothetical protein